MEGRIQSVQQASVAWCLPSPPALPLSKVDESVPQTQRVNLRGAHRHPPAGAPPLLDLPCSGCPTILQLTSRVCGTNSAALERGKARARQICVLTLARYGRRWCCRRRRRARWTPAAASTPPCRFISQKVFSTSCRSFISSPLWTP